MAVTVAAVLSPTGFWVGSGDNQLLVHSVEPGLSGSRLRPGQVVSVRGVLRNVPPDPQAALGIPAADAERVRAQGTYLHLLSISAA